MKVGITSKLFLAILSACVLVAVAMGLAVRFSFERGFIDYLRVQATQETRAFEQQLGAAYAARKGWDFLRDDPATWFPPETVQPSGESAGTPGPFASPHRDFAHPPLQSDRGRGGTGSGAANGNDLLLSDNTPFRPPHHPPFTLYDAQMKRIAGGDAPPPEAERRPIKVDGRIVGWLVIAGPGPGPLLYAADRQFQSQQVRATWVIVGFATLLSAVVAIALARVFLAPVKRLVDATHLLANGDYSTRIPEAGSDELQRLAADFNQLAVSLEKAERMRRNFIADISHELRTPLAVLRGELEAIEDGVRRPDGATIASLQSEVALLSRLIDELYELSLADIDELSFEKVPVDAMLIVGAAAESFQESFASKRIELEIDLAAASATMLGDPYRLTQLCRNLLQNSLRYTDPGGKVRVAVAADSGSLQIDVQDSYPSVPDPLLPHLFDRFFRVDPSRSRLSGGAGLGLALCKHIVLRHRGTIAATCSPLGGLWIKIRFPHLITGND